MYSSKEKFGLVYFYVIINCKLDKFWIGKDMNTDFDITGTVNSTTNLPQK